MVSQTDWNPTDDELRVIIAKALPDEGADLARLVLRERAEHEQRVEQIIRARNDTAQAAAEERDEYLAALAEVLRRCDVREAENPFNLPGHEVPTWIAVWDVRNAARVEGS